MSEGRIYRNGGVVRAAHPGLERADVWVRGAEIVAVGPGLRAGKGVEEIDCEGKVLLPGLYDVHTHVRGYGEESLGGIADAAARGGFTGLVLMPDGEPSIDEGSLVSSLREKAGRFPLEIEVAGCVTKGREGKALAAIAGMRAAGAVFLTDGDQAVENPRLLRRAMEYAKNFDLFVASHCDTPALSAGGAMNEGVISYQLGLPGMPALSEEVAMERDLRVAQYVGARIHVRSVTTKGGIDMIRRAKDQGMAVTAEVCPHHLLFDEAEIGDYDTNFKVLPPLRTAEDREHLLAGLREGVIDMIASDHAPRSVYAKRTDFESAPPGMSWLDLALVAVFHHLVKPGKLDWRQLVGAWSAAPRKFLGRAPVEIREGNRASFVIFDPEGKNRWGEETLGPEHRNTPFLGRELDGAVGEVIHEGKTIWKA